MVTMLLKPNNKYSSFWDLWKTYIIAVLVLPVNLHLSKPFESTSQIFFKKSE